MTLTLFYVSIVNCKYFSVVYIQLNVMKQYKEFPIEIEIIFISFNFIVVIFHLKSINEINKRNFYCENFVF